MADVTAIINQKQQVLTTTGIVSAATALALNRERGCFTIQNLGTNPLYVKLGAGATNSDFTIVLRAGVTNDDGTGGSLSMEAGTVYTGIITVAGTSPRYVAVEI